jgi:hypothetical protein
MRVSTKSKKNVSTKRIKKVAIRHIPPGDPVTCHDISISTSALAAHLDCGDFEGNCDTSCESFCVSVDLCSDVNLN